MTAPTTTSAFVREPSCGWEGWQRKVMTTAMASEIVTLFDQLADALREVLSDEAFETLDPLVLSLRDRATDIVDGLKGQVRW